jgi:hypothetical protein
LTRQIAGAATDANKITKQLAAGIQRAFIIPSDITIKERRISDHPIGIWEMSISFENTGNTPTRNLKTYYSCRMSQDDLITDPETIKIDKPSVFDVAALPPEQGTIGPHQSRNVEPCILWQYRNNDIMVKSVPKYYTRYYFGRAEYRDVLDSAIIHISEFCYFTWVAESLPSVDTVDHWRAKTGTCPTHNCTDDQCSQQDRDRAAKDLADSAQTALANTVPEKPSRPTKHRNRSHSG